MPSILKILPILALIPFTGAFAQVPEIRANSFEIGGFVGASYGIDAARVMGGGNVSYAVNKWLLPYVEYSYFPGFQRTQHSTGSLTVNGVTTTYPVESIYTLDLSDFHGGVHIRVPIRESKLVPYGVFGLGGIIYPTETVKAVKHQPTGTVTETNKYNGATDFTVNFGGGLRYYINQSWGVRLEAKVYKPTGLFTDVFGKVEFGVFVQLH